MRNPESRAQGLSASSGVVEGGCTSIVGGRLKKSGMQEEEPTASCPFDVPSTDRGMKS